MSELRQISSLQGEKSIKDADGNVVLLLRDRSEVPGWSYNDLDLTDDIQRRAEAMFYCSL